MDMVPLNRINDLIYDFAIGNRAADTDKNDDVSYECNNIRQLNDLPNDNGYESADAGSSVSRGSMPVDTTACPDETAYQTDLGLLNARRDECEEIIEKLFMPMVHGSLKPGTCRLNARKAYLSVARKNSKTHSVTYHMHVRPIVRGKEKSKVEFGSNIDVGLVDGYAFPDQLSWDACKEGNHLMVSVELFRKGHGCYPAEIMVDRIYYNRENSGRLKELGIKLRGKPLARPSEKNRVEYDTGDRNPIGGKSGKGR
jgi:hypothetical protein